jgi:hypothetical protein
MREAESARLVEERDEWRDAADVATRGSAAEKIAHRKWLRADYACRAFFEERGWEIEAARAADIAQKQAELDRADGQV